jgi:endo-alpha-1,4-polygalactosaminidase (GH114 family)
MWQPSSAAPIHWQWQLDTPLNMSTDLIPGVTVYDVDMFDNTGDVSTPASVSKTTVNALHALGFKVIAYIDVGTAEPGRPDSSSFPASVKGNGVQGWQGEYWLDIRQLSILQPIMQNRFAMAAAAGFDAVEIDNIDGCTNNTGFPLTTAEQLTYDEWCMQAVHALGMAVCQKNWIEECSVLSAYADFDLDEEAYYYNDPVQNLVTYYVDQGKAVFEVEYTSDIGKSTEQCPTMTGDHINSMTLDEDLVAPTTSGYYRVPCVPDTQSTWSGAPAANSFSPGSVQTAAFSSSGVLPSGKSCSVTVIVGTSSGSQTFTSTGTTQSFSISVTMPSTFGTYPVYIDIYMEGILVKSVTDPNQITVV